MKRLLVMVALALFASGCGSSGDGDDDSPSIDPQVQLCDPVPQQDEAPATEQTETSAPSETDSQ